MRTESEDPESQLLLCSELTDCRGISELRPKARLFVPFELGLLFSFQRPTLQNPVGVGGPTTSNYFGLPGRPGSAEFIEICSAVNSFFEILSGAFRGLLGLSRTRRRPKAHGLIRECDHEPSEPPVPSGASSLAAHPRLPHTTPERVTQYGHCRSGAQVKRERRATIW